MTTKSCKQNTHTHRHHSQCFYLSFLQTGLQTQCTKSQPCPPPACTRAHAHNNHTLQGVGLYLFTRTQSVFPPHQHECTTGPKRIDHTSYKYSTHTSSVPSSFTHALTRLTYMYRQFLSWTCKRTGMVSHLHTSSCYLPTRFPGPSLTLIHT